MDGTRSKWSPLILSKLQATWRTIGHKVRSPTSKTRMTLVCLRSTWCLLRFSNQCCRPRVSPNCHEYLDRPQNAPFHHHHAFAVLAFHHHLFPPSLFTCTSPRVGATFR